MDEVVRFDDMEVSMRTSRGMLTVHGEGLRVGRLAIDTGELAIDGAFDALDYTEETASAAASGRACSADEACTRSPSSGSWRWRWGLARRSGCCSTCCACRAAVRAGPVPARFSTSCSA